MRLTPWRQIAGSALQSPSSSYSTVQSIKRLHMQHNNFEAQLEPGGLPTSPPYLLITMSHGMSSVLLSAHITYLQVCSTLSVFDYMRQFNSLAQCGSYHVDTDEKKFNLYREGLTVHLQECLGLSPNLSYNELASAAIDQERLMKAIAEADEKKRKKMMPGSTGNGSSTGAPPKYRMMYTTPGGQLCQPQ
jgi:hypothetical protein